MRFYDLTKGTLTSFKWLKGFEGTEFPYPLFYGIAGEKTPGLERIKSALASVKGEAGEFDLDALLLAELVEAAREDRKQLFIGDDVLRDICIRLNEWINGWVLIIGDGERGVILQLIKGLVKRRIKVFVAGRVDARVKELSKELANLNPAEKTLFGWLPDPRIVEDVTSLGSSETGTVYFAQMLVRYALIYGRARAGDPHEISHKMEENAPGVVFVVGELSDAERLLVQGMLSLGTPVVALKRDQGLCGPVTVSATVDGMADAAWRLPNIRARLVEGATPAVPVPAGKIFAGEEIKDKDVGRRVSGSEQSFVVVRPLKGMKKDSVKVIGDMKNPSDFCVLVELGNRATDLPTTLWVETVLRQVINYAKGVKVKIDESGATHLVMTKEAVQSGFTIEHLGNLILTGLRNRFPEIGPMRVTFVLDEREARKIHSEMQSFVKERAGEVKEATEESEKEFCGCTRCDSFSLSHVCIVTPEHQAHCGTRPWYQLRAQSILAPSDVYNPCVLIRKGKVLDPMRGECEGVNRYVEHRTEGRVKRVFLHSIFDCPHTGCSCFQNLAFYIPEVDGIGLMDRSFSGAAPNGRTWTELANMTAGRQCREGVAPIATAYIGSRKFLQGDGGWGRIVWMNEALQKTAWNAIPAGYRNSIADEKDAKNIEELKKFLKRVRRNGSLKQK